MTVRSKITVVCYPTHDSDVDYDSTLSIKGLGFDPL